MNNQYILTTTEKQRLLINQNEYNELLVDLNNNRKFIVIQGHIIPLSIAPAVSPFANWYATENERLANSGKRLCKKCLKQMDIMDKCTCWELCKNEEQNAFKSSVLPDAIVERLARPFPELTESDRAQILLDTPENNIKYADSKGMLIYIDEASGDELYS